MTCEEAFDLISIQLDGELAVPDIARLERHLAGCEACRATQASESWLHSLLAAGALSEAPPDALRQRVRDQIAAEAAAASLERKRWWRRLVPSAFAGAMSVMLALLLVIHPHGRGAMESPVLADAVAAHRQYSDVSAPRLDVTGDAHSVERWIGERLDLAVKLPSGATRGETPIGARVASVGGRRAAQVLYAADDRRISLFVTRKPRTELPEEGEHIVDGAEVYVAAAGATNLGWWHDGRQLYVAVSSVGADDLLGLAALCIRTQRASGESPAVPEAAPARSHLPDSRSLGRDRPRAAHTVTV